MCCCARVYISAPLIALLFVYVCQKFVDLVSVFLFRFPPKLTGFFAVNRYTDTDARSDITCSDTTLVILYVRIVYYCILFAFELFSVRNCI